MGDSRICCCRRSWARTDEEKVEVVGGCCGKVEMARWHTGEEVVVIAVARNNRKLERFTAACDD